MPESAVIERLAANARRLSKPAQALAAALELHPAALVPGRMWLNLCCWCADKATGHEPVDVARPIKVELGASWCLRCPEHGPDVIVVSVADGR